MPSLYNHTMNFELNQVRLDQMGAQDPTAARILDNAQTFLRQQESDYRPDIIPNDMGDWRSNAAVHERASARIDRAERDYDSDDELEEEETPQAAVTRIIESERARAARSARLAASHDRYPAEDILYNTSLAEPDYESHGRLRGTCASLRAVQRHCQAAERAREAERNERASLTAQYRWERRHFHLNEAAWKADDALRSHRRHRGALQQAQDEQRAIWQASDPQEYQAWAQHRDLADRCSTSMSRRLQITLWYTQGVPASFYEATISLEDYYTQEARLLEVARIAEENAETQEPLTKLQKKMDDNVWAANPEGVAFGWEEQARNTRNGFGHYIPKGADMEYLRHLDANFQTRKLRIQHLATQTENEDVPPGFAETMKRKLISFVISALERIGEAIVGLGRSHWPLEGPNVAPDHRYFLQVARALETHLREAGMKQHHPELHFIDKTRVDFVQELAQEALLELAQKARGGGQTMEGGMNK